MESNHCSSVLHQFLVGHEVLWLEELVRRESLFHGKFAAATEAGAVCSFRFLDQLNGDQHGAGGTYESLISVVSALTF